MILNNIEYSINQSLDKSRHSTRNASNISPDKKHFSVRNQGTKAALLEQLSKNNNNKVGKQMLIIN